MPSPGPQAFLVLAVPGDQDRLLQVPCIPAEPCTAESGCALEFPAGVRWERVRNTVGKEKGILSRFVLA